MRISRKAQARIEHGIATLLALITLLMMALIISAAWL